MYYTVTLWNCIGIVITCQKGQDRILRALWRGLRQATLNYHVIADELLVIVLDPAQNVDEERFSFSKLSIDALLMNLVPPIQIR